MAQYLKPDSELGYVQDRAEIECLKINNLRHVVLGCMLGDFDETGAYVVDQEIVRELIEMPKYVVEVMDNIEICRSILRLDKQITFAVTFEGNKATLSLLEKLNFEANYKINSGTYSNINEFVLDSVETSGEINRNAIYARWNISQVGGNIIDIFNCDESVLEKYFGIVNRFKYLLNANKIFIEKEEELEQIEANYSNEVLEILKRYPKLEKIVMQQVAETIKEKKDAITIKKPYFAKTFNEILENVIQLNLSVLEENEKLEFQKEKRNAVVNLNVKRSQVLDVISKDIDNDKNADLAPRAIRLKTEVNQVSKSVQDLGKDFVSSYKKLENTKKDETIKENGTTEKDKLVSTLVGAGLETAISGSSNENLRNTVGSLVAETAEKVADKKDPIKAKTAGGKTKAKSPAKKSPAKKASAKKSGNKAKSGNKSKSNDNAKEDNKEKDNMLVSTTKRKKKIKDVNTGTATLDSSSSSNQKESNISVSTVDIGLMSVMEDARKKANTTVKTTEKVKDSSGGIVSSNQVKNNQGKSLNTQKTQKAQGGVVESSL